TATSNPEHDRKEHTAKEARDGKCRQRRIEHLKERIPWKAGQKLTAHAYEHTGDCPSGRPGQPHSECTSNASHQFGTESALAQTDAGTRYSRPSFARVVRNHSR